ncbi:hypothetical protein NC652_007737 [Populus alba x Populus x berolinensis]|nr:hypothetical protein NC652_007737 [Populus alba x Populus x berolinensis]
MEAAAAAAADQWWLWKVYKINLFFGKNNNDNDQITKVTDTSSGQARNGQYIQGIPWERLNISRENYRSTRLEQYKNYENIPLSGEAVDKECKPMEKGGHYYEFFYNTRSVKPTILHFQLRNLVWATSKHDVYLMSNYSVMHWSSISGNLSEVIDFAGHVAPSEKHAGSLLEGFTQTLISTIAVKDNFLVAGGCHGELTCKRVESISCHPTMMVVREYDLETFQLLNHFRFPWPVECWVLTRQVFEVSLKTVSTVEGHLDYSFASAWHPDGRVFATGNQDKTCRVWDIRKLSSPTAILKGNLGAVRSICFSSDGQFMYVAEPADFVHVYSTQDDYRRRQEIDFLR